jgi:hypothetical protein
MVRDRKFFEVCGIVDVLEDVYRASELKSRGSGDKSRDRHTQPKTTLQNPNSPLFAADKNLDLDTNYRWVREVNMDENRDMNERMKREVNLSTQNTVDVNTLNSPILVTVREPLS